MRWGSYLGLLLILFLDFLGMSLLVVRSVRYEIYNLFLLTLFILLAITIIGGVYNGRNWAWKAASLYFLLFLIVISFMYLNSRGVLVFGASSVLAAAGFLLAVFNIQKERMLHAPPAPEEEHEEPKVVPYGKVSKSYSPGKFIGSTRGGVYHTPKCDWAKRIRTPTWFISEEEAKKKGYKPHSCLEEVFVSKNM
jgi:hypothetical protein